MHILITGGSSGIGLALARVWAPRSQMIGLWARDSQRLANAASQLRAINPSLTVHTRTIDVGNAFQTADAGKDHLAVHGCPDVVVANAGLSVGVDTALAPDLAVFDEVVRTNLLSIPATFQPFIVPMRERGYGRLVGVASMAGLRGLPGHGAYCASKSGVMTYCESLRGELRASGVRVVTLIPGWIKTPLTEKNDYRMPFLMTADDFAQAAVSAIEKGETRRVIPWQMRWFAPLYRCLPNVVFDSVIRRAPRKARRSG